MQTIYLLEDNPIISKVIDKHFGKAGYNCTVFNRGDLLKNTLATNTPDVMICDIMVPGLTGLDIARYCKSTKHLAKVPIVILTAMTDQKYRHEAKEIGVDMYMTKDNLVLAKLVEDISQLIAK